VIGAYRGAIVALVLSSSCLLLGCELQTERPRTTLVIESGAIAVERTASALVEFDSRTISSEDGLPMVGLRSFDDVVLTIAGDAAPAAGTLDVYGTNKTDSKGSLLAQVTLAAGDPLPTGNLVAAPYEQLDSNGTNGTELLKRLMRNAAFGGYANQYPNFIMALRFVWTPDTPTDAPLEIGGVRIESQAAAAVTLYAGAPGRASRHLVLGAVGEATPSRISVAALNRCPGASPRG
jgi:hypothetical protein